MKSLLPTLLVILPLSATAASFNEKVDAIFSELNTTDGPGCSVGVMKNSEFIHKSAYGMANLELGVALSPDSVFRMASVSKQFTAMAVQILAQQGKIDLSKDIRTYLPELPDYGHKVSINAIIGHSAGMGDYDMITDDLMEEPAPKGVKLKSVAGGEFRLGNQDYLTIKEFYDVVKTAPLRHAPNEKTDYSNLGYFLLAMLVEEVSGQTLREFAEQHMFKPLNMKSTFFSDDPVEIIPNRATGYKPNKDKTGYVTDMTNLFWVGDGGLHTNLEDMAKWDKNYYEPVIGPKPQALIDTMNTPNSDLPIFEKYLYANGQVKGEHFGHQGYMHGGGWLGTRTGYVRYPESGLSVAIMCNNAAANASTEYLEKVVEAYFEEN
ncbi:serine hydrolase domain-containing protein [Aliiglaciecola litoralis]|uniref:Serine hydrolase domain-containing protein n=1 Tax=Aliiglaciecola litoralis TaxID=582857 RepID=A0ABN1LHB3_9ALTE